MFGSLACLLAIVAALASPTLSFAIDGAIPVYFAISKSDVPALILGSTPPPAG